MTAFDHTLDALARHARTLAEALGPDDAALTAALGALGGLDDAGGFLEAARAARPELVEACAQDEAELVQASPGLDPVRALALLVLAALAAEAVAGD